MKGNPRLALRAITSGQVKSIANSCGFELAGVAQALPLADFARFDRWRAAGKAGAMQYLTDHRGDMRQDPRSLLPNARSIICVGKLYNTPYPLSTEWPASHQAWISRYAWGEDYHAVLRRGLQSVVERLTAVSSEPFDWKICIDTAPLLERSYARAAGLGWLGKNTCLINQEQGSWFFLGELLVSFEVEPDSSPPDRCGTCRRCIDACPTQALVPGESGCELDARLCISYLTIEKRGEVRSEMHRDMGRHVFGCDICQDVCPWNQRAPFTAAPEFQAADFAPPLERLAELDEEQFRTLFRNSPVWRAKYAGFLRNVAIAMGNSNAPELIAPLQKLAAHSCPTVSEAAKTSLQRLAYSSKLPAE